MIGIDRSDRGLLKLALVKWFNAYPRHYAPVSVSSRAQPLGVVTEQRYGVKSEPPQGTLRRPISLTARGASKSPLSIEPPRF
jgi:hypothetical protein